MKNGVDIKKAIEAMVRPPDAAPPPVPPKPAEMPKGKTLGSIQVALQAQKIYDPSIPSVPIPSPAPNKPEELGTAANMGTDGRWGKPS